MALPVRGCLQADARDASAYPRLLGDEKAALLLTDPPYCLLTRRRKGGDLRDPRAHKKIDHEAVVRFESVRDYRAFTAEWLPKALGRLLPGAPAVIWTNLLGRAPLLEVAAAHGYGVHAGDFTWAKRTTDKNANEYLLRVYEVALVLTREPLPALSPADPPRCWSAVTAYEEGEAAATGDHPHHKPHGALEALVRQYSRPGELVLDVFAGSGSIPAAAVKLGRRAACMELRPEWARSVTERLSRLDQPA